MTDLLTAAVRYAEHGWAVFPLRPRSKHPLHKDAGGFHEATNDPQTVADWWAAAPMANIGLAPGPSQLLIADVDGTTAESTARALGLFDDPTLTVETGRPDFPGRHLYFRHPGGQVGNLRLAIHGGQLTRVAGTEPGLEIKADAGYVLLPPSIHPSGKRYRWTRPDETVIPWPSQSLACLTQETRPRIPIPETIPEGMRDDTLFRIGCALRNFGCPEPVILAALRGINKDCVSPELDDETVIQKAMSAARYQPGQQFTKPAPKQSRGSGFLPKTGRLLT